jgi:hypothetical protein
MEGIPNKLKPEIKEETEEEKIDIENHFHQAISSCEEDQLTRSVCLSLFILLWNYYQEFIKSMEDSLLGFFSF